MKTEKITRIVAPSLVFISIIFAIVAVATGASVPWLVGRDIRILNDGMTDVDSDPFIRDCSATLLCTGRGIILQLELFIGHSTASYCVLEEAAGDDQATVPCDENEAVVTRDSTYDEWLEIQEDGSGSPFLMLYDGCQISTTTANVVVSLAVIFMFFSLALDVLSFKRRFDKPLVTTFLLLLGLGFLIAGLIAWVLACQNTSTNLYSEITVGTGFIMLIIAIVFAFLGGLVRILRVKDFKYEPTSYI